MSRPAVTVPSPRLRGALHAAAFPVSLVCGAVLVALAPRPQAAVAVAVYALTLSGLLGVSALYHRGRWSGRAARWMQRLDHAMIFCLIAGTFTPVCALALPDALGGKLLAAVWAGAAVGIATRLVWADAPRWVTAVLAVALGWIGVAALPALVDHLGWTPTSLLLLGGVLYSLGAVVYMRRRPDPVPAVFGYHEVFHALVLAAAAVHYTTVAGWVLPRS